MKHLYRATVMGFEKKQEMIYFDSDYYTREEADAQFKRFRGVNSRGYGYTGFEYDGQRYHDVTYIGEVDTLPEYGQNLHELCEKAGTKAVFEKLK